MSVTPQIDADLAEMIAKFKPYVLELAAFSLKNYLTEKHGAAAKQAWVKSLRVMRGRQPTQIMNEAVERVLQDLDGGP